MSFWTYLIDNSHYYLVVLVTLFLWDLVDLYIELRKYEFMSFRFLSRKEFWIYYVVVGFFSIAAMEAGYLLNVFTDQSKYIVAFFIPLVFSIILQNLVVKIGGVENSIDIAKFFDRFRLTIKGSLIRHEDMSRVKTQMKLLNSSAKYDDILDWCRFYSTEEELKKFAKTLVNLNEKGQKIAAIKYLVGKAKSSEIVDLLLKQAEEVKTSEEKK